MATVVRNSGKTTVDSGASVVCTFGAAQAIGNSIIVCIASTDSAIPASAVTDNQGGTSGTYVLDFSDVETGSNQKCYVFRRPVTTANAIHVVTIATAAAQFSVGTAIEVNSLGTVLVTATTGTKTTSPQTATTVGTAFVGDVMFAVATVDGSNSVQGLSAPPTGFTDIANEQDDTAHICSDIAYKTATAGGTQSATFTVSAAMVDFIGILVVYAAGPTLIGRSVMQGPGLQASNRRNQFKAQAGSNTPPPPPPVPPLQIGQTYQAPPFNPFLFKGSPRGFSPNATQLLTVTMSGGLVFGGTSAEVRVRAPAPSGGITFGGAASNARGLDEGTRSGGIQFGGTAAEIRVRVALPSGGIVFGGSATYSNSSHQTFTYTMVGGITFGGATTALRVHSITGSGGVSFSGTAAQLQKKIQGMSGGLTFSGSAPYIPIVFGANNAGRTPRRYFNYFRR